MLLRHIGADVSVVHSNLIAEAELALNSTFALVPAFENGGHVVEVGDCERRIEVDCPY